MQSELIDNDLQQNCLFYEKKNVPEFPTLFIRARFSLKKELANDEMILGVKILWERSLWNVKLPPVGFILNRSFERGVLIVFGKMF